MIFDGVFAAPGDDDDVLDARGDALLDDVLNQRLVDDRQHLFGLRLGGRQKSRAQARCGKHGFAHSVWRFWHWSSAVWRAFTIWNRARNDTIRRGSQRCVNAN